MPKFDTLKKDIMTKDEEKKVKFAAKDLLHRLVEEHPRVLDQDWHKDSKSQRKVRSAIEGVLDRDLPESYDRVEFKKTCDHVYDLVYEYASKGLKWTATMSLYGDYENETMIFLQKITPFSYYTYKIQKIDMLKNFNNCGISLGIC